MSARHSPTALFPRPMESLPRAFPLAEAYTHGSHTMSRREMR